MKAVRDSSDMFGIIADEDTITGFCITGIVYDNVNPNFLVADHTTVTEELEQMIKTLISNKKIGIIFVADFVFLRVKNLIVNHKESLPCFLEIPSKIGIGRDV